MKDRFLLIAAAAICLAGCAKSASTNYGELAQNEFDAWITVNKQPSWQETELGSWILEWDKGDVANNPTQTVDEIPYVRLDFTISDLDGTVSSTSSKTMAQQLGSYDKRTYYGPDMTYRGTSAIYAGIEEVLDQMGLGGHCKIIVPGWLLTGDRYKTKQKYIDAMSESTDALVYDFTIKELVADENEWELNQIKKAMGDDFAKADSLAEGVYYIQDQESDNPDTTFIDGNSVYVNYICRRIDGTGIDTNIADSAKVFGNWTSGTTYEPTLINWGEEATDLTMTSDESSVITGFAYGIFNMKPHEKGRVYMTSGYGYSTSGSGTYIPGYCPIYFEIEMTDEPEDD